MTTAVTIAQLYNLTDRAATGLTADEQQRLRDGIDRLAEYEHTINWHTTCTGCARILDSAYAETVRAEKAEAAVTRAHALADRWILPGHISMPEAANDLRNALKDQP